MIPKSLLLGSVDLHYFEAWEGTGKARGPQADGGYEIINIQSIFSVLGFVPCIAETILLDCHMLHRVKKLANLCSSQFR